MADRPIIFSAPMVKALLDGRKSMTRRVLNPQPPVDARYSGVHFASDEPDSWFFNSPCGPEKVRERFAPGDRLYVREAWAAHHEYDQCKPMGIPSHEDIWLVADGPVEPAWTGRWRSSIHMPRRASRLTLTVTEVGVQRLQDISVADVRAEGVDVLHYVHPKHTFSTLWNSLHGPDAWDANPWVVAVSFTVHKGNIDTP